jgi:hypothetical protein
MRFGVCKEVNIATDGRQQPQKGLQAMQIIDINHKGFTCAANDR